MSDALNDSTSSTPSPSTPTLTEQQQQRRQTRAELERDFGIDAFPAHGWDVTARAADLLATFDDAVHGLADGQDTHEGPLRASIAGRVMSLRVMGKAAFLHVADASGQIQVYVRRDDIGADLYNALVKKRLDLGDIVGVEGAVFRTRMGEVSLHATRFALLAKALRPLPVEKEVRDEATGEVTTFNEITDKEFRYRQRYADLALHPDVRRVFVERARMVRAIRDFLDARGYVEVETPALQPVYGGAAARPFTTHHNALDMPLFLRIADELYLKRCIVGGFEGVYEIAKDFRNEGMDRKHQPEFTMLELYVAYKDYAWMMDTVEEMIEHVATTLHGTPEVTLTTPSGETHTVSFRRPWARIPMFEAIEQKTGHALRGKDREAVAEAARAVGVEVTPAMGTGKLLDEIFGLCVEPTLIQPTFITDYPVELSPLAKRHRSEEGLVERFEAIVGGKEICNAFSELNDPDEQRARFEDQGRLKTGGDDEAMVLDEDFLRALEYGMPPTAGLGVGIDRLAMLMTGQSSIRDVLLFPLMRPEETP